MRGLGQGGIQGNRLLSELIDRLAGPRLILHANANPENGAAELDYLSAVAAEYPVSAWKIYPHTGSLLFDSEEIGGPFVERARSLGVRLIAAHRGISNGGGYASAGSPRDVVRVARTAPDLNFLVYHSGWESADARTTRTIPSSPTPRASTASFERCWRTSWGQQAMCTQSWARPGST